MSEEELRPQSEWNDALGYIGRLNKLFYTVTSCKLERPINIYDWMMALDALFTELSTEMKEAELQKAQAYLIKVRDGVSKATQNRGYIKGQLDSKVVDDLREFELFLRRIYKDSGLQMRVMKDSRHAFG